VRQGVGQEELNPRSIDQGSAEVARTYIIARIRGDHRWIIGIGSLINSG
jgi:hypothetical protein